MTMDEHAQQTRTHHLSPERRRTLDEVVRRVRGELKGDLERLYVVDQLRQSERRGRPGTTEQERKQRHADVTFRSLPLSEAMRMSRAARAARRSGQIVSTPPTLLASVAASAPREVRDRERHRRPPGPGT
jgi:hypothetical protein